MKLYKLFQLQSNSCSIKERNILLSFICCIAVSFLLNSCNNSTKQKDVKLNIIVDTVIFDAGFQFSSGIRIVEYNNSEYVGFADLRTAKKISVFDISGKPSFSVSVDSLMISENTRFFSFCFASIDSLALLSAYTNKLVVIDTNGKALYKKDYSPLLFHGIQLFPPFYLSKNHLKVGVKYLENNLPENPTKEDYINTNEKTLAFYNLLYDTAFYEKSDPLLQLDSFYCRFGSKTQILTEGNHILMLDSLNISHSSYSDSLYVYNTKGKLLKTVCIKSEHTKVGINPITYEQYWANNDLLNRNVWENGFISDLLWDKYRNVYYCFVRSAMIDKKLPFSIIILDKDFNNLGETKFDYNKYHLSAFVGKRGLYIMQADNKKFGKYTFSIFRYE